MFDNMGLGKLLSLFVREISRVEKRGKSSLLVYCTFNNSTGKIEGMKYEIVQKSVSGGLVPL